MPAEAKAAGAPAGAGVVTEDLASEYARLFAQVERHRLLQAAMQDQQDAYDGQRAEVVREAQSLGSLGAARTFMHSLLNAVPRPEVPGEIPESRRLHDLAVLIAKEAANGSAP